MKFRSNRGQSLVEMLVAISIIVVSLLGILALINRSLGLNRVVADQYIATYLAAEGIELVKNYFDHSYFISSGPFYGWQGAGAIIPGVYQIGYDDSNAALSPLFSVSDPPTSDKIREWFFAPSGGFPSLAFLNFNNGNGVYSYNSGGTPTKFKRLIYIYNPTVYSGAAYEYTVTSAVGWTSRGGKFVVQLQNHFLPWRTF